MKVISMFSGAGGMDLGFILAGHEIVWANDFDKDARETYINNISYYHKHPYILDDIIKYLDKSQEEINNLIPDADVLIGGFPCQGFSIANINRNMEDERNKLYLQILKVLRVKKPKFFILENVKGLENMEKGEVLKLILNDLSEPAKGLKYRIKYNILNALDYGVPQNRERIIIFGVRSDVDFDIPEKENIENNLKTLYIKPTHSSDSEVLDTIPAYEKINILYSRWINNEPLNTQEFISDGVIKKYTRIKETIFDLPKKFEADYHIKNHTGSNSKLYPKDDKRSKYVGNRPTEWKSHCPTVMGRGSGTGGPLIIPHPSHTRRLSVRETARIQSFPDKFIFYGSNSAGYRQIGNAVPVLMALNIAKVLPI